MSKALTSREVVWFARAQSRRVDDDGGGASFVIAPGCREHATSGWSPDLLHHQAEHDSNTHVGGTQTRRGFRRARASRAPGAAQGEVDGCVLPPRVAQREHRSPWSATP